LWLNNSFTKKVGQYEGYDSSRVVLLSDVPSAFNSVKLALSARKKPIEYEEKEAYSQDQPAHSKKFISLNISTGEVEIGVRTDEASKETNPSTPEESMRSFQEARKSLTTQDNYVPVDKILQNLISDCEKTKRTIHYPAPKSKNGHLNVPKTVSLKVRDRAKSGVKRLLNLKKRNMFYEENDLPYFTDNEANSF